MTPNPKFAAELFHVLRLRLHDAELADAIAAIRIGAVTPLQAAFVVRNEANLGRITFSANAFRDCRYVAQALCDAGLAQRTDFPGVLSAHN